MGDFEDVFGAGADAVEIIDRYSRQYQRASAREKANWHGTATEEELEVADYADELDAWRQRMVARGYTKGPKFSTYAELSVWDRENKRAHIRRRNGEGFEVFFTDRQSSDAPKSESDPPTVDEDTPVFKLGGKMLPATQVELREDLERHCGYSGAIHDVTSMTAAWWEFESLNKKRDNYWRTRLAAEDLTDDDIDDALKLIFWFAGRHSLRRLTTPTRHEP